MPNIRLVLCNSNATSFDVATLSAKNTIARLKICSFGFENIIGVDRLNSVHIKMSLQRKCPFHVTIAETEAKLVQSLCDVLQRCANRALENSGTFRVGLSGACFYMHINT